METSGTDPVVAPVDGGAVDEKFGSALPANWTPEQWASVQAVYAHQYPANAGAALPGGIPNVNGYMNGVPYAQQHMYMGGYYPYMLGQQFPFGGGTLPVASVVSETCKPDVESGGEIGVSAETKPASSDLSKGDKSAQLEQSTLTQALISPACDSASGVVPPAYPGTFEPVPPSAAYSDVWRAPQAAQPPAPPQQVPPPAAVKAAPQPASTAPAASLAPEHSAPLSHLDERELKRQRRKQSNRESARRSRLRKQAECERLAGSVDDLKTHHSNMAQEVAELRAKLTKISGDKAALVAQVRSLGGTVAEEVLRDPPDPVPRVAEAQLALQQQLDPS